MNRESGTRLAQAFFLVSTLCWTEAPLCAAPSIFTDESAYVNALSSAPNDYGSFVESFEGPAWDSTRSTGTIINATDQVTNYGITWTSKKQIATSSGASRTGTYGIFPWPHGNPDSLTGRSGYVLYGIGGWLRTNTPPAKIILILDNPDPAVYEDAEDFSIDGWSVYKGDPNDPSVYVDNFLDSERGRVIELAGDQGMDNGYALRNADGSGWQNTAQFVAEWSMKYKEDFLVYLDVETSEGKRTLIYSPVEVNHLGSGETVHHGLGLFEEIGDPEKQAQWRTFVRDLQADLSEAQPGVSIVQVEGFGVDGSGRVDDIKLHNSMSIELELPGPAHRFLGMIEPAGFKRFEIFEMQGKAEDPKFLFADDFIFATPAVPPVANADAYSVLEGGTIDTVSQGLPGVLANDTGGPGISLTAILVTPPGSGSLVFAADGSFEYTPASGFSGTDFFEYKANDGKSSSNGCPVTLNVLKRITKGDVNMDRNLDLLDIILSLQVLSGANTNQAKKEADVNGDGLIGLKDTIYILEIVSQTRKLR